MNIPNYECPVPTDQRPINEYNSLKNAIFFFWTTQPTNLYLRDLMRLSIVIYGLIGIIIKISTLNSELSSNDLGYMFTFGSTLLILCCLRLYLGWSYIYDRLIKASVTYEESGWYDGQTWIKPPEYLIQDKLIATYELLPILTRLKQSLLFFFSLTLLSCIYWNYSN